MNQGWSTSSTRYTCFICLKPMNFALEMKRNKKEAQNTHPTWAHSSSSALNLKFDESMNELTKCDLSYSIPMTNMTNHENTKATPSNMNLKYKQAQIQLDIAQNVTLLWASVPFQH